MSEHITHIAVYEDAVRIVRRSGQFSKSFKTALNEAYDSGMITCGSRGNHLFAVPLLEETREAWKAGKANQEIKQKLAGAIGWITHRAADRHAKPLFWAVDDENNPKFSGNEYRIYHDVSSYKEVYNSGKKDTLSPYEYFSPALMEKNMASEPAADFVNIEAVEPIFTTQWQSDFLLLHQLTEEPDYSDEWLKKMFNSTQDYQENWKLYIQTFNDPDPEKWEKYITGPNYYDRDDDIIKLVRSIQEGQPDDTINLEKALKKAKQESHYAQMLRKCYDFIMAANKFFEYKIDKTAAYDGLEIGEMWRK